MCNTLLFESHYFLMYIITGSLLAHRAPAIKRTTVPAKAFIKYSYYALADHRPPHHRTDNIHHHDMIANAGWSESKQYTIDAPNKT
jgi:hypothetical protein